MNIYGPAAAARAVIHRVPFFSHSSLFFSLFFRHTQPPTRESQARESYRDRQIRQLCRGVFREGRTGEEAEKIDRKETQIYTVYTYERERERVCVCVGGGVEWLRERDCNPRILPRLFREREREKETEDRRYRRLIGHLSLLLLLSYRMYVYIYVHAQERERFYPSFRNVLSLSLGRALIAPINMAEKVIARVIGLFLAC